MSNKTKIIIGCILAGILILTSLTVSCVNYFGVRKQLRVLSESFQQIESSVSIVRDGIRQQESAIAELTEQQRGIDLTVNELANTVRQSNDYIEQLIGTEQGVDGIIGSARATSEELRDSIQLTLNGVREEGVQ